MTAPSDIDRIRDERMIDRIHSTPKPLYKAEDIDALLAAVDERDARIAQLERHYSFEAQALLAAEGRIARIRLLHGQYVGEQTTSKFCLQDGFDYPCPTIRELDS